MSVFVAGPRSSASSPTLDQAPAASLVLRAAQLVGFKAVDSVVANMLDQCITEGWQLKHLQGADWKELGAPLGMAAAVQRILQEGTSEVPLLENTAGVLRGHPPHHPSGCCGRNIGQFMWAFREFMGYWCLADLFLPRDHQLLYKQCHIAAQDGSDVKGHTLMVSELWAVISALFAGASAALWSMAPAAAATDVRYIFEWLSLVVFYLQIFSAGDYVLFCVVCSAVPAHNFKAFMTVAVGLLQFCEIFFIGSMYTFMAQIGLLGYMRLEEVSPGRTANLYGVLGFAFTMIGVCFTLYVNPVAALAQHGGFLGAKVVSESSEEGQIRADVQAHIQLYPTQEDCFGYYLGVQSLGGHQQSHEPSVDGMHVSSVACALHM